MHFLAEFVVFVYRMKQWERCSESKERKQMEKKEKAETGRKSKIAPQVTSIF
jgi:Na+-transporting methylmalonyl-CoA/oxaloacetate decarboxylase gamma subunit